MAVNDGGPAFPSLEVYEGYNSDRERYEVQSDVATGMSLRDWFAGQALALGGDYFRSNAASGPATVAQCCYEIADAMLKAREATHGD